MPNTQNLIELLLSALNSGREHTSEQSSMWKNPATEFGAAHLLEFMNAMPGGFFIYRANDDEEILYANAAILRIFGCETMEEFRSHTRNSFRGFVHPDDLAEVEQSIHQQVARSQLDLDHVEYRIIRKDGTIRWLEDYGHFIRSAVSGDLFYVFASDSTEKKQRQIQERAALLQETLQKSQTIQAFNQQLEGLNREHIRRLEVIEGLSVDYASIFYVDLDTNQIQTYRASSRVQYQFGKNFRPQKFTGFADEYMHTWVYSEDQQLFSDTMDPAYIRGRLADHKMFYINYRVLIHDRLEYLQMRIVNVGHQNHVSQVIIGVRSVEQELRNEITQRETLTHALNQAKSAMVAKNAFLSNMSHDIRTPLNAIVGFTALAKKHLNHSEKGLEYLDMIENSSNQLIQLLNDVLEISRLEADRIDLHSDECDLSDIAREIETIFLPRIRAKEQSLTLDLSGLRHPLVYGDRTQLLQLISRLVSNAINYTDCKGHIRITISETDNAVSGYGSYCFIVEDNGIGIDQDFISHIFEPFERQKNTTLSGIYGTGLGLTIVKNIVDAMGGTIDVSSTPMKGSRFTVTLSLPVLNQPAALSSGMEPLFTASIEGQKILVVDDNELNLEIELELLTDFGFQAESASNGQIAVDMVAASHPGEYALILMDLQMPVMDGHEAARAIRALPDPVLSRIPIIALSANAFDEDKRKSLESGMNAHMAKPLDIHQLMELLRQATGCQEELL